MLHQKAFIAFLNRFGQQCTLNIPSIDKIVFIIAVAPVNLGLTQKAGNTEPCSGIIYLQQGCCNITPVDMVDQILSAAVSGGVQPGLVIVDVLKGNIRMRQRQFLQHVTDISALGLGSL